MALDSLSESQPIPQQDTAPSSAKPAPRVHSDLPTNTRPDPAFRRDLMAGGSGICHGPSGANARVSESCRDGQPDPMIAGT